MADNAYSALADWFEYLNDDCGYEEWSQYLLSVLQKNGAGKTGIDLGCGSGYFTRQLYKNGYAVTGVDKSGEMLQKAASLAKKEGLAIPFVQADAAALRWGKRVDFIVSLNDCFNYVSAEKLPVAFRKAAACLKKGGFFFFDVSTPYKFDRMPPVSADDREDITYLDFRKREGEKETIEVTLFVKGEDGKYERYDETHTQYIHTQEAIVTALESAGFDLLSASGHLGTETSCAERWEFSARRR